MGRRLACIAAACALLAGSGSAPGATAVVGGVHASELRVAFARTGDWTTVWTSARIEDDPGPFALIVPLPEGAFVDQSSDAWFEALEAATAPRVFPPDGLSPYCPGVNGPPDPFHVAGSIAHVAAALPETITIADDTAAVATWLAAHSLTLGAEVKSALDAVSAAKFLCVKFNAPDGVAVTPALRITAPKGLPALPFSIARAEVADLRVTTFFLGDGRAALDGATTVPVPAGDLVWNAKSAVSSYRPYTAELLAGQPGAAILESAGHDALLEAAPIAGGTASIDAFAQAYFERASAYGNAPANPAPCVSAATLALTSEQPVGAQCPRGDLAALAGPCTAVPPGAGEIDPAKLLCGPGADDLAIALSGAVPADAWLTRRSFVIAKSAAGKDRTVSFGAGAEKLPILEAGGVDLGDCFGGAGGATTTSSSSSSSSTTTTSSASVGGGGASSGGGFHGGGNGSGGSYAGSGGYGGYAGYGGYGYGGTNIYVDSGGCSCSGTADSSDTAPADGDDCDSGSSSSDSSSGDDCDSGSSSDSSSSESSGDDCDSGSSSSDESDDWGSESSSDGTTIADPGGDYPAASRSSSGHCALGRGPSAGRRKPALRLSVITMAMVAFLMPLRRLGRKKKRDAPESASR